ncbi:MAG: hypothetical protein IT288_07170 [Bdellovibrionales bacterium]|nr:hypothetical protein [Bdellovibrionales bacterium]
MKNLKFLVGLLAVVSISPSAFSASLSLSKNPDVASKPAIDLIDGEGNPLSQGQVSSLLAQQKDTSIYHPKADNSRLWEPKAHTGTDENSHGYPANGATVRFVKDEAYNRFTYMARVQDPRNPRKYFRFAISRFTHAMLMRAALLRKLGYLVTSPKFYNNLTVSFRSKEEMEEFLRVSQEESINDFEGRKWITAKDEAKFTVTFSNATLEPARPEYFDVHWAFVPNPEDPRQRAMVQNLGQYRAFRGLIVPFVLVDVPESVNRFSPKFGHIQSDSIIMTHEKASTFRTCGLDDAKWVVRRLSYFKQQDWEEIVRLGQFPKEIDHMVLARLLHRVQNMFELFGIEPQERLQMPDLNYTSPSGLVKDGKVTQEFVEGYPQRFAHGDRESPFTEADIGRYVSIEALSTGLKYALDQVNKKLVVQDVADLALKRQKEFQQRVIDHIRTRPNEILEYKLESWGGPVANFDIGASRHVTTGTYYDSHAPIQLVDTVNVGGTVGYFRAIDGMVTISNAFAGMIPTIGGNVSYNRTFNHVRPIESLKQATEYDWGKLYVPGFMNSLAGILEAEDFDPTKCQADLAKLAKEKGVEVTALPDEDQAKCRQPLHRFITELKDGEIFTITDSLVVGGYVNIYSPLDILLGLSPLGFLNSVSFGFDSSKALILKQTNVLRTSKGLQIISRTADSSTIGAQFDLNYWLNLLRIRAETKNTEIHSIPYLIDYNAELAQYVDKNDPNGKKIADRGKNLKAALHALFAENDMELFNAFFKDRRFEVDHKLTTSELQVKLLTERFTRMNEGHLLKIRYPANPDYPNLKPEDEEVTIFSYKKGRLIGRNIIDFFSDFIDGLFKRVGILSRPKATNPADTPFGKGHWKIVTTESDLTKNGEKYPSVSFVQEVWGGWKLKKNDFLKLIDEITTQFRNVNLGSHRIIEPEAFINVTSVDFYRITANLSITEDGMNRIRDLLLQPEKANLDRDADRMSRERDQAMNPLARFGAGISQGIGTISDKYQGKYLPSDRGLYEEIVALMGRGSYQQGQSEYMGACKEEALRAQNGGRSADTVEHNPTVAGMLYRTEYECLASWMSRLIQLKRAYPDEDRQRQTEWTTEVLWTMSENIPLPYILEFVGKKNFIFFIRVNGFRAGDEDGDLEFFSNSAGDPAKDFEVANGIIDLYSKKTGIAPLELRRTQGSFQ